MNTSDIPVKDQDKPFIEEHTGPDAVQGNMLQQPVPVVTRQAKQPPVWTGYAPGTPPPWVWQPGVSTPYPPRRPSRWPWVVLTLVLLFLLIGGGITVLFGVFAFTGYAPSGTQTQTYTMSTYPRLVLDNDIGSIHVQAAAASNVISIQATKHGSPWANLNDLQVSYAQNTTTNTVTVSVNRVNPTSFFNSLRVDFDVTVPSAAALQLKTNTGSIDVSGVSGQMTLSSNTGSLQVSGGTVKGNTTLVTNTGSITFNGAITEGGTYTFTTDTGSVNVTLPAESVFQLDATTTTGSINTNFPGIVVQHPQMTGAEAHGDVGASPTATMTLRTSTGSINLYQG